jgi:hypothetical protein
MRPCQQGIFTDSPNRHSRHHHDRLVHPGASNLFEHAIQQISLRTAVLEDMVDIFAAAGLVKPDILIPSVDSWPTYATCHSATPMELLQKMLEGKLSPCRRKNVVQACPFAKMLDQAIRWHQNSAIEAAQAIEETAPVRDEDECGEHPPHPYPCPNGTPSRSW